MQFAVIRTTGTGIAKKRWIMSIHATRDLGNARLRAYVQGVLDGSRESAAAIARFLPHGEPLVNLVPALRVVGVEDHAKPRAFYTGKIFSRKARLSLHAHSRTKKTG